MQATANMGRDRTIAARDGLNRPVVENNHPDQKGFGRPVRRVSDRERTG
jgi:hypothetical protein